MKRIFLILFIILSFSAAGFPAAKSAPEKNIIIQAGMGFGLYKSEGDLQVPPVGITAEYTKNFTTNLQFSFGGTLAYAKSQKKTATPFGYWTTDYTYRIAGFRADWHYSKLIKPVPPELDLYAGGMLGWAFASVDENPPPGCPAAYPPPLSKGSYFLPGAFAGARYYFTQSFGIFCEGGFGTGYVTLGIVTKW